MQNLLITNRPLSNKVYDLSFTLNAAAEDVIQRAEVVFHDENDNLGDCRVAEISISTGHSDVDVLILSHADAPNYKTKIMLDTISDAKVSLTLAGLALEQEHIGWVEPKSAASVARHFSIG